ncbi:MAG: sulfatase-like hydrolase/transferase [Pseudomonadota bacterium]
MTLLTTLLGACAGRDAGTPEGGAEQAEDRPNFLVIDLDSLRADRWLAERAGEPIAPNLTALAARGVVFEQAISQSAWTMPALESLLSGHWPVALGEQEGNLWWLPDGAQTLPTLLALYGYHTVYWGGSTLAADEGPRLGFAESLPRPAGDRHQPGDAMAAWLRDQAEEPFFAYLHDADLHMPDLFADATSTCRWAPYPEICAQGGPASPPRAFGRAKDALGWQAGLEEARAEYDGVITAYDLGVPALLGALAERGLADRTVVIVVSDHGEDLGEHGLFDHGAHFDTILRIPLLIMDPRPGAPGPGRVAEQVQAMDLAPTVLALASVPADTTMDGTSLVPLLRGEPWGGGERIAFSLSDRRTASARTPAWKVVHSPIPHPPARADPHHTSSDQIEAFDLASDPLEHRNQYRPVGTCAELEAALTDWLAQRVALASSTPGEAQDDPALRERLQRDGYWKHVERDRDAGDPAPRSP